MQNGGLNVMEKGLTSIQRVAICFAAGVGIEVAELPGD